MTAAADGTASSTASCPSSPSSSAERPPRPMPRLPVVAMTSATSRGCPLRKRSATAAAAAATGTPATTPPTRRPTTKRATACYCFIMVINGGLVGAFGPSLEPFARQTGSSAGALGSAVMQNRLAKLAGTVLWGYYAAHVQQQKRTANALPIQPHTLISLSLLLLAASCAVFGHTKSAGMLQLMMIVSGFMYGVSDSAANLLITWVWQHDARKQRINVATLNAAFTIGAFVTPIVCAASMHHLRGHVWPAYYILALCAILEACILPYLPTPPAPRAPPTPRSSSRLKTFAAEEEDDEPSGGAGDAGAPDASPLQTPPASRPPPPPPPPPPPRRRPANSSSQASSRLRRRSSRRSRRRRRRAGGCTWATPSARRCCRATSS